jgi:O-acetyl-ADP-ribose deacetylase (regulator of RNase III)
MCNVVIHIDMSGINAANQSGGFFSAFSAKLKDKIKLVLDKADELKMRQVALPALGKGEVSFRYAWEGMGEITYHIDIHSV